MTSSTLPTYLTQPTGSTLPTDQLLGYISGARWFGGKGRRPELHAVSPLPWVVESNDPDEPSVRFEVAELGYPDDPVAVREHYLLGLSYRAKAQPRLEHALIGRSGDDQLGYDALQDPQACRLILAALLEGRRLASPNAEVRFWLGTAGALSVDLEPQVYTGQQSNTSVMFGDVAMIKFFRRLELGRNLDIEVHEALNRAGVADVAGLFGWVEGSWSNRDHDQPLTADLAMVVEKLADAHDGWDLALTSVAAASSTDPSAGSDFGQDAQDLGAALAATHQALRSAFPTAQLAGAAVAMIMKDRLRRAVSSTTALEPYVDGLVRRFDDLAATQLDTQRVHGDFHLGQTLRTPTGWKIIDFEGEPVKTLAERAAPDSVYRDIAGMLRSFDYAAASALGPAGRGWAAQCRSAFLSGYAGRALADQDAAILRAYEADKAVYEVVYEVRNRPDWVGIPLAAVAALAGPDDSGRTRGPDHHPHLTQNQAEE